MTYQEDKQVRMRRQNSKQAISLAMQGLWKEAVAVNAGLIENFPHDVEAYNRLGKAYSELGEYTEAKEAYAKAVEMDPYNVIAKRNLQRLSHFAGDAVDSQTLVEKIEPQHFIEEIGKARVVEVYELASPEIVAKVVAGDKVNLKIDRNKLVIETVYGQHLGQVNPLDGQRLVKLIEGGNTYIAAVVSSTANSISIIIREEYQHPSQAGHLSFPPRRIEEVQYYTGEKARRLDKEHDEELSEVHNHGESDLLADDLYEIEEDKLDSNA